MLGGAVSNLTSSHIGLVDVDLGGSTEDHGWSLAMRSATSSEIEKCLRHHWALITSAWVFLKGSKCSQNLKLCFVLVCKQSFSRVSVVDELLHA